MSLYSEVSIVEDELRENGRTWYARPISGYFRANRKNGSAAAPKPRFRVKSIAPAVKPGPPKALMRVLLRNAKTLKFVQSGERWTNTPKQARDFRNGWRAAVHAFTMNPRLLVIHYEFDDDRYNLQIPVISERLTGQGAIEPVSTRKTAA
jgi:hypothetical protein